MKTVIQKPSSGSLIALALMCLWLIGSNVCAEDIGLDSRIQSIVSEIEHESDSKTRIAAAKRLSQTIRSLPKVALVNIEQDSIVAISSLLGDRLDAVKAYAAIALGDIGPPAKIAVPALEAGIKRMEFWYE